MEAERVREVERWERPPCYVDAQEACPLARLAEGAKARPEGAWDEKRRRSRAGRKGACVRAAPVVVVRGCSEENKKARVDADRSVKRERVESGRAAARVRVRDRRRRE